MPAKNPSALRGPAVLVCVVNVRSGRDQPACSLAIDVALGDELTTLLHLSLKWPEEIAELPAGSSSLPERSVAHPRTDEPTRRHQEHAHDRRAEDVCSPPCPLVNIGCNCTFIFR